LLTAGGSNFGYDDEGQLSSGYNGTSYTFDYEHRLTAIGSSYQFQYDGRGNRLQAVRNGTTTRYIYDPAGNVLAEADVNNNVTRIYIYGKALLAVVTPSTSQDLVYCYHFNATGSTIAMTDQSQNVVNKYSYDPFGNILNQQEAVPQPFKFVGQYGVMTEKYGSADSDIFYYMRARYYDPKVGRFISEDPTGFDGGDVNLMTYVGNNPVMGIDPSGLCSTPSWLTTAQDVNNGVAVVSLIATLTPSGVSNAVGAAGLGITTAVGLGIDAYSIAKGYNTEEHIASAAITTITFGTGIVAREAIAAGVKYSYKAERFYTVNANGMWRFVKTQLGIQGKRIDAAFSGLGAAAANLYQDYMPY
jgi:RHS repeat-associated protein